LDQFPIQALALVHMYGKVKYFVCIIRKIQNIQENALPGTYQDT